MCIDIFISQPSSSELGHFVSLGPDAKGCGEAFSVCERRGPLER